MALFGSKKNTEGAKPARKEKAAKEPKKAAKKEGAASEAGAPSRDLSHVLKNPRITEKATLVSEAANVYVFDVSPRATKKDVVEAVKFYYKAEPAKVNMAKVPSKQIFVRGKWGVKSGGKKAYVFLKKGETIEIL